MIFIVGFSLALGAATLRSAAAVATVGVMILMTFAAAALSTTSGVSVLPLLVALAGYNAGLAIAFLGALALSRRPSRAV